MQLVDLSLESLQFLAVKLATVVTKGDVVLLNGDLGAGKTTFARLLINAIIGQDVLVPSPTFTLVQTYEAKNFDIWHLDLYRLTNKEEIYELGIEDAFDTGLLMIEWYEIIKEILPENQIHINLEFSLEPDKRNITIIPHGSWQIRMNSTF